MGMLLIVQSLDRQNEHDAEQGEQSLTLGLPSRGGGGASMHRGDSSFHPSVAGKQVRASYCSYAAPTSHKVCKKDKIHT